MCMHNIADKYEDTKKIVDIVNRKQVTFLNTRTVFLSFENNWHIHLQLGPIISLHKHQIQ